MTSVRPLARFGNITLKGSKITNFSEKDSLQEGWINGGFFVLNKKYLIILIIQNYRYLREDTLPLLAKNNQLMALNTMISGTPWIL